MIKYFKELLATLIKIEAHLASLSGCVKVNDNKHGAKKYIVTGHWND